jgi:hypothetical protein
MNVVPLATPPTFQALTLNGAIHILHKHLGSAQLILDLCIDEGPKRYVTMGRKLIGGLMA